MLCNCYIRTSFNISSLGNSWKLIKWTVTTWSARKLSSASFFCIWKSHFEAYVCRFVQGWFDLKQLVKTGIEIIGISKFQNGGRCCWDVSIGSIVFAYICNTFFAFTVLFIVATYAPMSSVCWCVFILTIKTWLHKIVKHPKSLSAIGDDLFVWFVCDVMMILVRETGCIF